MGRISSSIGLVSSFPIVDTVDKLIAISARPRDLLVSRTKLLQSEQTAVSELTAAVLAVQLAGQALGKAEVFSKTTATSSNSALLGVTVTGTPSPGSQQFTPLAQAQTQQLLSSGFASRTAPVGAGTITIGQGGFVNDAIALEHLNAGQGVAKGKIRITDRSGASAEIDLRFALNIDDVLSAINDASGIDVTATAEGDRIRLTDNTGQTISNLRVQEVGSGSTAADLGLASINAAANTALGSDVLSLHEGTLLSTLNDGNGLSLRQGVADLTISFRDGSADLSIDFNELATSEARESATLGDLLAVLNDADPARLQAQISADGDHIELIDLTTDDGETFSVTSAFDGTLAEELGLTVAADDDTITGRRFQAGLKDTLLTTLGGGRGLGILGDLDLQDRNGDDATIALSSAETLGDVIRAVNAAGLDLIAAVNRAGNGLEIRDTSGGSQNLIIANGDATNTATKLGIAINSAANTKDSGSLHRQFISRQTKLTDYNGGAGVEEGQFVIVDSQGAASVINVDEDVETIGDLLDAINSASVGVLAEINETGDGIRLIDTAGGGQTLRVDAGAGDSTAADLRLLGEAVVVDVEGSPEQVIDGSTLLTIDISETDTLEDVVEKLNDLDAELSASLLSDGSGTTPHRLSLVSGRSGIAGRLLVDASAAGFTLDEVVSAKDARLLLGSTATGGLVVSSSSNSFAEVLAGASLTIGGTSSDPVTVSVSTTDSSAVQAVELLVNSYNKLQDKLDQHTFFNDTDNTIGALFGSNEALRVESEISRLFTGRFFGVGTVQSLEQIGISVSDAGKLTLDKAKLQAKFAEDPEALAEFFTDETSGFAAKLDTVAEALVGEDSSLLINRAESLSRKVDFNQERAAFLTARLDSQRELLLKQFFAMEAAIAKMQDALTVVQQLQALPPLTISGG